MLTLKQKILIKRIEFFKHSPFSKKLITSDHPQLTVLLSRSDYLAYLLIPAEQTEHLHDLDIYCLDKESVILESERILAMDAFNALDPKLRKSIITCGSIFLKKLAFRSGVLVTPPL